MSTDVQLDDALVTKVTTETLVRPDEVFAPDVDEYVIAQGYAVRPESEKAVQRA